MNTFMYHPSETNLSMLWVHCTYKINQSERFVCKTHDETSANAPSNLYLISQFSLLSVASIQSHNEGCTCTHGTSEVCNRNL
jgi:hypothetical protein